MVNFGGLLAIVLSAAAFWYLLTASAIVLAGPGWIILAIFLLILYWTLKKR